jgi:hypothetical protein
MAVVVLTSTSGAPGVTALAVGLSLAWPRSVLLADCDPGAHQAVLGGFLAGLSPDGKGLLRVAEAHRDRRPLTEVVLDQSLPLSVGHTHSRRFLPGFSRPGSANLFGGVWGDLMEAFDRLGEAEVDVIVDAGRIGPAGLPQPMLDRAGVLALVLRSSLRSVVSARVHLTSLKEEAAAAGSDRRLGLLVVGEGDPYGAGEIAKALGLPVLGTVAYDPGGAAHLSDGRARPRRFESSALNRSLHAIASALHERLQRTDVGSDRLVRG